MTDPPILPGCTVLPPMEPPRPAPDRRTADTQSKGNPGRRCTRDRFGTLNAFVDCGMADLSRSEALTWLVLFRDTRDGTARTAADDVARRIGASRRAVTSAMGRLRRRGLLTLVYRGGLNRGTSRYRVHPLPKDS